MGPVPPKELKGLAVKVIQLVVRSALTGLEGLAVQVICRALTGLEGLAVQVMSEVLSLVIQV